MTGPVSNPKLSLASPDTGDARSASVSADTTASLPTSWQKTIELLEYLNAVVEPVELVEFAVKQIAPGLPSRHMESVAVARALGVSRNTVENWRNAATKCSMPLRLAVATAKTLDGPDALLSELSRFTGEDHTCHFSWFGGQS
ncbi:hypothetical protein [Tateyamaria sp.]|uniref:hypothetical protein n=1 Tax=Tateyamaria sp. TaxID=1929288 RepID=UPI003B222657